MAGLAIATEGSKLSESLAFGPFLRLPCSQLLKMRTGCFVVRTRRSLFTLASPLLIKTTARVLNGIGTGMLNAITPVWATEIASHTSRGMFVAMEFTLNIFGVVVAYWLQLWVLQTQGQSTELTVLQRHIKVQRPYVFFHLEIPDCVSDCPFGCSISHDMVHARVATMARESGA